MIERLHRYLAGPHRIHCVALGLLLLALVGGTWLAEARFGVLHWTIGAIGAALTAAPAIRGGLLWGIGRLWPVLVAQIERYPTLRKTSMTDQTVTIPAEPATSVQLPGFFAALMAFGAAAHTAEVSKSDADIVAAMHSAVAVFRAGRPLAVKLIAEIYPEAAAPQPAAMVPVPEGLPVS
jgi:hypothetical protein